MRRLNATELGDCSCSPYVSWQTVLRDAAIVVAASAAVAFAVNGVRDDGLALVQKEEYQILVPCPETTGEVTRVEGDTSMLHASHALIIDARSSDEFAKWHAPRAVNIPFDYLAPTPSDVVHRTASSGAQEVVVYGDGDDPDSGEQLARELSGKGIRNVHFVIGGVDAIIAAGHRGTTP